MFGNPGTPSPGFSATALKGDEEVVSVKILACRPADLTDVPASVWETWAPLGHGCLTDYCDSCKRQVQVGPAQVQQYLGAQGSQLIMCLSCTSILMMQDDVDTSTTVIRDLGRK